MTRRYGWMLAIVVLGAAIGSAALIGALVVGDSVKGSLRERALQSLPGVWAALPSGDRYFSADLVARLYAISTNHWTTTNVMLGIPTFGPDSIGYAMLQLPANVSK